jgi:hypothetical protein
MVETVVHLTVDRKQTQRMRRGPGQDIFPKDAFPVAFFLQLGPIS